MKSEATIFRFSFLDMVQKGRNIIEGSEYGKRDKASETEREGVHFDRGSPSSKKIRKNMDRADALTRVNT
jgi:hypothetical protein